MANFMYNTTDEDCCEEIGQLADGKVYTRHLFLKTQQDARQQEMQWLVFLHSDNTAALKTTTDFPVFL